MAAPITSLRAQGLRSLTASRVAGGFSSPVFATAPPGDTARLFVVQQSGQIRIVDLLSGSIKPTAYLDISSEIVFGGEQGLLGLAFDPNYAANGRFYLNYTAPGGSFGAGVTHIAQFTVSTNPDVADPASERTVLQFDQPQTNHNGGWIGFSPRSGDTGNLYIATGDGGNANDAGTGHIEPGGNAQNVTTLLGKMLRIHINTRPPGTYSIPADNPFAGSTTARQEIWAFGLRNPYRDSFDRQTGTMFIGDVGQDTREEVDAQSPANPGGGENYGWRVREGFVQNPAYPNDPVPPDALDPIYDYTHTVGQTVIGGYVYRGNQIQVLRGFYVFADYLGPEGGPGTGRVLVFRYNGRAVSGFRDITTQLFPTAQGGFPLNNPSSLGEDASGELYITDIGNGNLYKLTAR
ncbi:MAG: PQQ-dependent sugar dehydrogenase [Chthoniobacterales bacterium]|nr:PQQ-dependent sugar dehydrogenase [Chthoniobacterales bacterium]